MSKLRAPQIDTGTGANQIVELDGAGNIPASIGGTGIKWQGTWADGSYFTDDMVKDGDWTMIAIADTSDRAAPQSDGTPEYSINPSVEFSSASDVSVVKMVHRFTMLKTGWVQELRVRVPFWDLDSVSSVTVINVTSGETSVITNPILKSNEWVSLSIGNALYTTGTVGEIWFEFYNSSDANNIDGDWNSDIGTGTPSSQEFTIDDVDNPTVIEIDHTDNDSNNRATELDGVAPNSIILIYETGDNARNVEVEVAAVDTTSGSSTKYTVTLINVGSKSIRDNRDCSVSINEPPTPPSQYSVITDYFSGTTNQPSFAIIDTELYYDGVQQVDVDDAYGIDILFQEASFSPDWDVVAVSNNSGSSSSTAGGSSGYGKYKNADQTVNNSTTLVDDTELNFTEIAIGSYEIEIMLAINGPTAADMKLGWTVTNETSFLGAWAFPTTPATPDTMSYTVVTGVADESVVQTDNVTHIVKFNGSLNIIGDPGTLTLRFAQSTATAADTKILTGSYMKLTKLN